MGDENKVKLKTMVFTGLIYPDGGTGLFISGDVSLYDAVKAYFKDILSKEDEKKIITLN